VFARSHVIHNHKMTTADYRHIVAISANLWL
jgi:hypothetical protein